MKFTTNDLNVFIRFAKNIYMSKSTFIMIKPDAVERGLIGNILKDIKKKANDWKKNLRNRSTVGACKRKSDSSSKGT